MNNIINNSTEIIINGEIKSFVSTGDEKRIKISYYFNKENKHVYASVLFGDLSQGPPGLVHGGAIAAVLDETMGITSWMNNFKVMTTELKTAFMRAIKLNSTVYVDSWIDKSNDKAVVIKSKMISENGEIVFAEAEGLFAILDSDKWKSFGIDTGKFVSKNYLKK